MNKLGDHRLTDNVKLLQKAVIFHDGQILLLKRHAKSVNRPNCWDLPGGNSEWPNLTGDLSRGLHLQDLAREIQEETGILIDPKNIFQRDLVFFDTTFQPDKQVFTVLVGWHHILAGEKPEVKISHEHTEFVWINPDEIDNYDFGFAQFIPKMIRRAVAKL